MSIVASALAATVTAAFGLGRTVLGNQVYSRAIDLMEAKVGDELVALEPQAGKCFGFNEVATSIWRSLEQPRSFDQLRDLLVDEYAVDEEQCSQELNQLLDDLVAKGLIKKA